MKRVLILVLILGVSGAALYYSERHKQETHVGPEAVLNALADTQRQMSRVPAAMTRILAIQRGRYYAATGGNTL